MSNKRLELEMIATDAVQRTGLHALSFRTLADQAGVKSSSVHYYFPEKADLASALIRKYTEDFVDKLAAIDARQLGPRRKLEAFVDIFQDVVKAEKLCLCGMMAADVALLGKDNRNALIEYFRRAEDWLRNVFEEHNEDVTSTLEPRVLARLVMSGLEGAILIDRVDGGLLRLRALREWVRTLVE